jgi:GntR family transcriptional regulator/MocR family aminotransferase
VGDAVAFSVPHGGVALLVRFTEAVDVESWAQRSTERGVWRYAGKRYAFDRKAIPCAWFNFAWLNERELPEAVRRLAAARPSSRR